MVKSFLFTVAFALTILIFSVSCSEAPPPQEQELTGALDDIIRYGEANQIDSLFMRFTPPADYKRLSDAGELKVAIERFQVFKYDFIRAMKEAKTIKPTFNEDSTRAEFNIVDVHVPGGKIVFSKIDGQWYITD